MTRFHYTSEFEESKSSVDLIWDEEEEDIQEILYRFKLFLIAKTYSPSLVKRITYLTDDQLAKLNLLQEDISDDL